MATITLYGNRINQMPGFIRDIKKSVNNFKSELSSLRQKTLGVNSSVCNLDDVVSSIQASTQTQERKAEALDAFAKKSEEFISDTYRIDREVGDIVGQRKDDFYKKYSYLKPEEKKSGWDSFWEGVGNWCKEHWKEIVVGLAFIVVGALITVFTAGTGTPFLVAFGAALLKGMVVASIASLIGGGINAGATYYMCRKSGLSPSEALGYAKTAFGEGAASGFMAGGIGFAAGAAYVGVFGSESLVGHSLLSSIGKGARFGGITNMMTSPLVTFFNDVLFDGRMDYSFGTYLNSVFTGLVTGGISGGIFGGLSYLKAEYRIQRMEDSIRSRTDLDPTEKGRLYESKAIKEYSLRNPNAKYDSQCRLNSDNLVNKSGNTTYQKPDLLVENSPGSFTNYDFKWGNATKTTIQKMLTGGGDYHVFDTLISNTHTEFSTSVVPAGTPFIEVHPGSFNSVFGARINTYPIITFTPSLNKLFELFK